MLETRNFTEKNSSKCDRHTAEMDFLIAQKMMYEITTVVWADKYDVDGEVKKVVYEMTLSDLLEHWLETLDKNRQDIISIKPV
ncbi:MAG: hypothetical protein FVQ79_05270 [Planctomycetes bacterium]|nr:hypothetical protein [Planctomycetota bacterium]